MPEHLLRRKPLHRVNFHHLLHQLPRVGTDGPAEPHGAQIRHGATPNAVEQQIIVALVLEWGLARQHDVHQHAQRVDVGLKPVGRPAHDFRRHI